MRTFVSKRKLVSQSSYQGDFSLRGVFLLSILTYLLINLKVITRRKPAKQSVRQTIKTAAGQCIPFVNEIINSENTSKEIVKSFIDLANMAKGLMNKNQQLSVKQEFGRRFPSARGGGREVKPESFIGLVHVSHLLLQQLIEILVLQHRLPHNGRLQKQEDKKLVENQSKFATFSV